MTLERSTKERIVAEECKKFLDEGFGQLDLSGSPDLQNVPLESFEQQDKYGFSRIDTSGMPRTNLLREFVENPDSETLARVAEETGDDSLTAEILDERAARVARQFCARNPYYFSDDENLLRIVNRLSEKFLGGFFEAEELDGGIGELTAGGFWTVPNLETAYRELLADGLLKTPSNVPRNLNAFERLEVVRLCQAGLLGDGLQKYLSCALGDDDPSASIAADPSLVGICDEAVIFCFENGTFDYVPTEARRRFIRNFAAGRPLNMGLVAQAWSACKLSEKDAARSELLGLRQDAPSDRESVVENLDELSDDEVNGLYKQTRRHIARISRGPGVLD